METLILIIVLAVFAVAVVAETGWLLLVRPRRLRRGEAPVEVSPPEAPGEDELRTPSREAAESAQAVMAPTAPPRVPDQPPAPEIEKPPPSAGRLVRLRDRLSRSQSSVGSVLLGLLSRDRLDDDTWDEIEEVLITADVGVTPARQIVSDLRTQVKVEGTRTPDEVRSMLRAELLAQVETPASRALRTQRHEGRPAVILMVGVNGTGKTTTCGKLARSLIGDGESVVLGAADTFRAAAADQLQTWGDRVGAEVVRSDREGADPASVAYEAVSQGIETEADVVLIDTGRL